MPIAVCYILGALTAIAATVLTLIFITPEKKRASLNKFFAVLHDIFNFKFLVLELILKVCYIFTTLFCIGFGFFVLFNFEVYTTWTGTHFSYDGWVGFPIMIFGPIVARLVYEGILMFLLLVKNTIEINKKLPNKGASAETKTADAPAAPKAPSTPDAPTAPAEDALEPVYCGKCGTRCLGGVGFCPRCGNKLN